MLHPGGAVPVAHETNPGGIGTRPLSGEVAGGTPWPEAAEVGWSHAARGRRRAGCLHRSSEYRPQILKLVEEVPHVVAGPMDAMGMQVL